MFHTSSLTKFLEIHRVEFRDAKKVTFKSIDKNEIGAPQIYEIDHTNCTGGALCDIDSCNLSTCTALTQLLDPGKAKPNNNLCPRSGLCLDIRPGHRGMLSDSLRITTSGVFQSLVTITTMILTNTLLS